MTTVGVICEAAGDFHAALTLQRRVVCERVDWVDGESYEQTHPQIGISTGSKYSLWRDLHKIAPAWPARRAHGKFSGEAGSPMASAARLALLHFNAHSPDAVILMKDGDDQGDDRLHGLEQARAAGDWKFPVLIAVPRPEIESWSLTGFTARDPEEEQRLDEARARLGFDPTRTPEELTSKNETSKRDCKRALRELVLEADNERRASCLEHTALEALIARGAKNGLAAFIAELSEKLVPLSAGHSFGSGA